jgi:dihydrofolate synthase / folylpolyglutamate synthase
MFNSYSEVLRYLYDNLPIFQRVGSSAYKKDLSNTIQLCDQLGNPHRRFKSIHVAGTNGKGSTSHMLAAILQTSGYKTGLYTSPHLKSFTERIKVNGQEISQQFIVNFVNGMRPLIEEIKPSFFEITVAMAFEYFAQEKVDIAVIEVGLGGRLDSTNIITPEVSVITNIGWDHKDILGDTLEKIAYEKAGIIKPKVPVVISERQENIDQIFLRQAAETKSLIYFGSDDFRFKRHERPDKITYDVFHGGDLIFRDLYIPLQGYYQQKNLSGVLKTIEILDHNNWGITAAGVVGGLSNVVLLTGLKGRWQRLGDRPLTICDTGHNIDGLREIVKQIAAQTFQKLHFVFGVVRDKELEPLLDILPKEAFYYFCEANIPRAMQAEELASKAAARGLKGKVITDVNAAVNEARRNASPDDMIFIGGSTFVVAELENI